MSQTQPKRPPTAAKTEDAVTYGDVFDVGTQLAKEPVRPLDAAMMQAEEDRVLGETQQEGPAAAMQAAAAANVHRHVVVPGDVTTEVADKGVSVDKKEVPGGDRVYKEYVAGKVICEYQETMED